MCVCVCVCVYECVCVCTSVYECVCVCVTHGHAAQRYTDARAKVSDVELIHQIKRWMVQYIKLQWVLWRSCARGLSRLLLLEGLENTTELRIVQDSLLPSAHISGKQLLHHIPDTHTHTHTHTRTKLNHKLFGRVSQSELRHVHTTNN